MYYTRIKNGLAKIRDMNNINLGLKLRLNFIKYVLSSKFHIIFALASSFLFGLALISLSNIESISLGMGRLVANIHESVIILLALLFGLNLTLLRVRITSAMSQQTRSIGTTTVASILGFLFAGCASCGLTLASYIGLGAFAALLPWHGLEVNIFACILLLYSIWNLGTPEMCDMPQTKSKLAKKYRSI